MIPGSISLAVCTVVLRRVLDTVTGQIPALPVSQVPHPSTLLMFSGALYCIYNHLRKGTLVKIGRGHLPRSCATSSRNSIQHRSKNRSWFLRNAWGRRKNYTDAVYKVAKQFSESLTNMNPCLLLPKKTFQVSFPKEPRGGPSSRDDSEKNISPQNSCDLIYSNEAFATESNPDVKTDDKRNLVNSSGDAGPRSKRGRKSLKVLKSVKRLGHEKKSGDILSKSISTKFQEEAKKITRSGRVYNPFT